jgi:hypothetical protein
MARASTPSQATTSYCVPVNEDVIIGDEPPVNGMDVAVRVRHDFTITDAELLLASALAAYLELNPGTTAPVPSGHSQPARGISRYHIGQRGQPVLQDSVARPEAMPSVPGEAAPLRE